MRGWWRPWLVLETNPVSSEEPLEEPHEMHYQRCAEPPLESCNRTTNGSQSNPPSLGKQSSVSHLNYLTSRCPVHSVISLWDLTQGSEHVFMEHPGHLICQTTSLFFVSYVYFASFISQTSHLVIRFIPFRGVSDWERSLQHLEQIWNVDDFFRLA